MSKSRKYPSTLNMVLLFALGLLVLFVRSRPSTNLQVRETIINKLMAAGYSNRFARMWVAVAQFESGNFTNTLFRKYNNIFSMTMPKIRKTTAIGETVEKFDKPPQKFAIFSSVASSIDDLILYLRARVYPMDFNSLADLVRFMKKKNYFTMNEAEYLQGVEKYYIGIDKPQNKLA